MENLLKWLKTNWKKTSFLLIGFICILLLAYYCGRQSTSATIGMHKQNLIAARDSVKHYSVTINGLKTSVAEKDAIILDKNQAIDAGIIEKGKLKALHMKELVTNASLKGRIKILEDSLKLPNDTTIVIVKIKDTTGIARDYIRIPFTLLDVENQYLSLNAGLKENKTAYYDMEVPFSGEMSVGYVKSGFLKTKPVGTFTSSNPYLKINNMDILIIPEKKKWYQSFWIHALAGGAIVEGINLLGK